MRRYRERVRVGGSRCIYESGDAHLVRVRVGVRVKIGVRVRIGVGVRA